jgi:putative endopeptidase
MRISFLAALLAPLFAIAACAVATRAPDDAGAQLDVAGMDPSVPPDESFFKYANGGWLDRTEIPPDRSNWGIGSVVQLRTDERIRALIEDAAANNSGADPTARKVGDYFASFMDESAIENLGAKPLQPELERIAAIGDKKQLAAWLGSELRADVDMFNNTDINTPNLFGLWVAQDLAEPTRYSAFLVQGGLDMPDREYYLADSPKMAEARTQFEGHVARTLALAGLDDAVVRAHRVAALERKIAQAHVSRTETDDVKRGLTHWKAKKFAASAPGLDWKAFFEAAGLSGQPQFVVWQPEAATRLAALVRREPLQAWKDWAAFHATDAMSGFLPKAFAEEHFAFHDKALNGTPELRARWKRGVELTGEALGEPVGRLYVEKYFSAADKAAVEQMVRDLIAAFGRRIDNLAWMNPKTKERARAKLSVLYVGVGYPDRWADYGDLSIERGDAYGNEQRANLFRYRQSLAKLGKPVDRTEWCMNPQLVNAVNLPAMNALNFPAAMLQPPYFDTRRPASMNYGAIGSVIGHEISHSFDDQGALFDAEGRLNNWWTEEDYAHFTAAGRQLVAQYDAYRPLPDMALKGELVLGENIADVAGLAVAYDAWQRSLGGTPAPVGQGFSGPQQFFISFAQSWRRKYREPALRQRILTDAHSPSEWRVATVRNLDEWYEAFAIAPPGHALYLKPEDRVRIW